MLPCVRVKDGVEFTMIAPGGFCILAAINATTAFVGRDLTITSACDGIHSGIDDPHHRGEAYDVRTHDLPDKLAALQQIINLLGEERFYCFLEDPDSENEHIHCQVRRGIPFP